MNNNGYRITAIVLIFSVLIMSAACAVRSGKMTNERRMAIEYLNNAARFLQRGMVNEAVIFITSGLDNIIQTDDHDLNVYYLTIILKILDLYGHHDHTLSFIREYMQTKDFLLADPNAKRGMKFLYIETLIKNGKFDTAKEEIHKMLENREYRKRFLHIIYAHFFILYRESDYLFTDERLVNDLIDQKADELSKMVFIKNAGLYYYDREEYRKALSLFLRYNNFVRGMGFTSEIALSYHYMARIYFLTGKYSEGVYSYFKAYYIYESYNDFNKLYPLLEEFYESSIVLGDEGLSGSIQRKISDNTANYEHDKNTIRKRNELLFQVLNNFRNLSYTKR